jgi:type II secretory pathway pseudopilin PulG
MVKLSKCLRGQSCPRLKQGFGIVEALVAAAVLGFLYMALLNLQSGNREALLRIRGRDGATEVAQNIIDSLGALGIASLSDDKLKNSEGNVEHTKLLPPITRVWEGQPGAVTNKMTVIYAAEVTVSPDADYMASTPSLFETSKHVYAKRLDVKVKWCFKCPNSQDTSTFNQSITVSGVIR